MKKRESLEYNEFAGVKNLILQAISEVYCNLSPENLSCDGELSLTQVNYRRAEANRQLKGLFLAYGRNVSETEIYSWLDSKRQSEFAREQS